MAGFRCPLTVGAVLFVWMITQQTIDGRFWLAVAVSLLALSLGSWFIFRDINRAAKRLRELEKDINCRAGEKLLVWETGWGGAVTGYWGEAKPLSEYDKKI